MARPKNSIPKLCTDSNGRAFTKVCGRFISLGKAGTPDAARRYAEVLTANANGQEIVKASKPTPPKRCLTINELCIQFVTREIPRYSSGEAYAFKAAIRVLRPLFGDTPVDDFGPVRYRLMRDSMVAGDVATDRKPWARPTVNRQAKRIRQIFRWGVSHELVPVEIVHRLDTVRSLAMGETTAHDNPARLAVPREDVDAARLHLKPIHRDVLDLLLLTGARRGEILKLTGAMIQKRPDVWIAELHEHKTARKGKRRILAFNRTAQAILLRHLKADPDSLLFSVRADTFTNAVAAACAAADVPHFCPHQLRHAAGATLVDELGIEIAQAVLGHSDAVMTAHYARSSERKAIEGVQKLG